MSRSLCYTNGGRVLDVPETEILEPKPEYLYLPMSGFAYVAAVEDKGICIGYIRCGTLGFPSVKDYFAKHGGPGG